MSAAIERVGLAVRSYVESLRAHHDEQTRQIRRRLAVIEQKRDRMFDAYAAGAMSLAQFKRKQEQLDGEAASTTNLLEVSIGTYERLEELASTALALAGNAAEAYEQATPLVRRPINQAIFTRLLVTEDGVESAIMARPFSDLYSEAFIEELEQATAKLRGSKRPTPGDFRRPGVGMTKQWRARRDSNSRPSVP